MTDLKGELASLKIDRTKKASSPYRWPLLLERSVRLTADTTTG